MPTSIPSSAALRIERRRPRVGVLDAEERVVGGAPTVDGPPAHQRVPRGVHPDGLDEPGRRGPHQQVRRFLDGGGAVQVVVPSGQHLRHQGGPPVRRHPQVEEPGPGHLGVRDLGPADERVGQPARQLARRDPDPARGAQGDARGVLAVRGVARPLDAGVGRQRREVEPADGQDLGRGGAHEVVEQGGGHQVDSREWTSACSAAACSSTHVALRRRS